MPGIIGNMSDSARTRLIEVASALLTAGGQDAVTTRAVAAAAGVQPPTIYRVFGDKEGLLDAVADHVLGVYTEGKSTDGSAAPLEDFRAGWDQHIDFGLTNPSVFVLMTDPRRAARSTAAVLGREVLLARIRRIAATGRLRMDEQHAADLTHAAGTGTVLTLIASPAGRRDRTLADTAYRAVLAAITVDAPVVAEPGPVAAAAALRASTDALSCLSPAERQLLAEWLDRITRA